MVHHLFHHFLAASAAAASTCDDISAAIVKVLFRSTIAGCAAAASCKMARYCHRTGSHTVHITSSTGTARPRSYSWVDRQRCIVVAASVVVVLDTPDSVSKTQHTQKEKEKEETSTNFDACNT